MQKNLITTIVIFIFTLMMGLWWTYFARSILISDYSWAIPAALIGGGVAGVVRGIRKTRNRKTNTMAARHTVDSFLEHWGTGTGIFLMMVSGFKIVLDVSLWEINLHFLGLIVTLFFGFYFVGDFVASRKYEELLPDASDIYHGTIKKYLLRASWKDTGKYQSSQRAAFLSFVVIGSEIVVSGGIKAAAQFGSVANDVLKIATYIHDTAAVLFVLLLAVHIGLVILVKAHRKLLPTWFTGGAIKAQHEAIAVEQDNQEVSSVGFDIQDRRG
jgi:cytochrome b subunit of formate dehydrogenase